MPVAPPMIPAADFCSEPLSHAERELFEHRLWKRQALRRGFIATLSLALAALLVGISIPVGTHLVAAWWLERLHCAVVWVMDESNWRQGGTTTVSIRTRSWGWSDLSNADLNHLKKLHRVVSLNLAEA